MVKEALLCHFLGKKAEGGIGDVVAAHVRDLAAFCSCSPYRALYRLPSSFRNIIRARVAKNEID